MEKILKSKKKRERERGVYIHLKRCLIILKIMAVLKRLKNIEMLKGQDGKLEN